MMSSKTGKFITIEGVEGVGKTTNIDFIRQWLEQQKISHVATRGPGGTPLAESIRELLLSPRDEAVDENTELLMMFAARAQHLAIAAGQLVLTDPEASADRDFNGLGVFYFRQLAQMTSHDVDWFAGRLKLVPGRILRHDWASQAKQQHFRKYNEQL